MSKALISFCIAFALLVLVACAQAGSDVNSAPATLETNCQLDNPSLQAMPLVEVSFLRSDGSVFKTMAKLANSISTRAAGFQNVCASTIAATPILFAFERETQPSFHMNNVVAPIDIAFIDKRGRIESVQSMKPYSLLLVKKPVYSPDRPVVVAFEAHPGFFKKHDIAFDSRF